MAFVTSEIIALNGAREQLFRLEEALDSLKGVEIPQQYEAPVVNARELLARQMPWVQQALDNVFKLGPSVEGQADLIKREVSAAATMIELYARQFSESHS